MVDPEELALVELPPPPPPPCLLEPLPAIEDYEAKEFEANAGSEDVVDLDGLTPATVKALQRFQRVVISVGGAIELKSAYRPQAYQEHLQAVWDKWMDLRDNTDEGCRDLRAQAEEEFTHHGLLESQRPAPHSDHTRGLAFDAAVSVPSRARFRRRRVNVDYLARISGIRRPVVANDPVHFRLIASASR